MSIHPTAIVSKHAEVGANVEIGPYAIVEDGARIGDGCVLRARAHICSGAELGAGSQVHMGAVVGYVPQDFSYKGEPIRTVLGKNVILRENVTIHGSKNEGGTRLGDNCYLMVNSHVAHDCVLGNDVLLVNGALLAGYVHIDDGAVISGNTGIHQFVRVGRYAIVAGISRFGMDIPPYMIADGVNTISTLNTVGLRRAKSLTDDDRKQIKAAFKVLYRSNLSLKDALQRLKAEFTSPAVAYWVEFYTSPSKRGFCRHRFGGRRATLTAES